jgi:hypothetical protein
VLFEHARGKEGRLETMGRAVTDDPAEAAERRPAVGLLVVRQSIQVSLHIERSPQARDEPPLLRRESSPLSLLRQ